MGTPITEKGLSAALNNCAFVSTQMESNRTQDEQLDMRGSSTFGTSVGLRQNNGSYSSSGTHEVDATQPFCFLMDAAMLGVGEWVSLRL